MLKITNKVLGYPVYENKNYCVCPVEKTGGRVGIQVEYEGRYLVQDVMIYPHNGKVAFDYPEALPNYVIEKVYVLARKIVNDKMHIEFNDRH